MILVIEGGAPPTLRDCNMTRDARAIVAFIAVTLSVAGAPRGFAEDAAPDPIALLRAVEKERMAITSGTMTVDVTEIVAQMPNEPIRARAVLVFDGDKCKVDQYRRSLMINWFHGRSDPQKRDRLVAMFGSPEQVVADGLGYWLDDHSRLIYDGAMLMRYSRGTPSYVSSRRRETREFLFDPRTLGISGTLGLPIVSVSKILMPHANNSVSMASHEIVGGVAAWHVVIRDAPNGAERHFWIGPPGHRVYRVETRSPIGSRVILSEYASPDSGDAGPLPVRVKVVSHDRRGKTDHELVLQRVSAPGASQVNVAIDPATWTLAGLGMPIGEPVSDELGDLTKIVYWDGKALTKVQPQQAPEARVAHPRPSAEKLLQVARRIPDDSLAVDAIAQIARDKSAAENREALELLSKHHVASPGVGAIGLQLLDTQPERAEAFLRAVLDKNPSREDQGLACFGLGTLINRRAEHDGQVGNEAEQLLERVLARYSDIRMGVGGLTIGEEAKVELRDLRAVGIGKPAPELDGKDLDGKPLKLSDSRGKVVVLTFWSTSCRPCLEMIPHERKLVARMSGRPFALLGVNGVDDLTVARATHEKESMTWPSWWVGSNFTAIVEQWGVRVLPTTYVIDAKGVIRFKNLRGESLEKAVESLLAEHRP
jgi:peroxiredoxin